MNPVKIQSWSAKLADEMRAAGLTVHQLASRLGVASQSVEKQLSGRQNPPSDEVQARYLAACRAPAPSIASLVDDFETEMRRRLQTLANDLETVMSGAASTPDAKLGAAAVARPVRRRAAT